MMKRTTDGHWVEDSSSCNLQAIAFSKSGRVAQITSPATHSSNYYSETILPSEDIFLQLEHLYHANQPDFGRGGVDIFSQKNRDGAVHFNRTSDWFKTQLSMPGACLITHEVAYEDLPSKDKRSKVLAFILYFTDATNFPSFAYDCKKYAKIPGLENVAYVYLVLTAEENRGTGHGTRIYLEMLDDCAKKGHPIVVHEYVNAPVLNEESVCLLRRLDKVGFRHTYAGITTKHVMADGGAISYQQVFVPTSTNTYLQADGNGFQLLSDDHPVSELYPRHGLGEGSP